MSSARHAPAGASVSASTKVVRLRAKAAVTDRSILFVGAMNFDARSDPQNTQIGLFIERPETARPAVKLFEVLKPQGTCPLRLTTIQRCLSAVSLGLT